MEMYGKLVQNCEYDARSTVLWKIDSASQRKKDKCSRQDLFFIRLWLYLYSICKRKKRDTAQKGKTAVYYICIIKTLLLEKKKELFPWEWQQ